MRTVSRRSLLRGSFTLAAAGALMKPYIANAAATTATVWWTQGFAEQEDISYKKLVADHEKAAAVRSTTRSRPMRRCARKSSRQ